MSFIHLLLEVYCSHGWGDRDDGPIPEFCACGKGKPGYHCMSNNCDFISYTHADYELAYAEQNGCVPDSEARIGFGGDMEPDDRKIAELRELWEAICRRKINEAYDEYMKITGFPKWNEPK